MHFVEITPKAFARWPEAARAELAGLMHAAVTGFFDLIPLSHTEKMILITAQIAIAGTETQTGYALVSDGAMAAAASLIDADTIDITRQAGALMMIRALDPAVRAGFIAGLQAYATDVEPLSAPGTYLSRLAVAAPFRSRAIGAAMLAHCLAVHPQCAHSLHVHRDNAAAIALYRKFGFEFQSHAFYAYRAMVLLAR